MEKEKKRKCYSLEVTAAEKIENKSRIQKRKRKGEENTAAEGLDVRCSGGLCAMRRCARSGGGIRLRLRRRCARGSAAAVSSARWRRKGGESKGRFECGGGKICPLPPI